MLDIEPKRKVRTTGRNVIGDFPSIKMGKMIPYESTLELDLFRVLDFEESISEFHAQPLEIEYQQGSKTRKLFPDVLGIGERYTVFECKPEVFLAKNQSKFDVIHAWCDERGWDFIVITDTLLRSSIRFHNIVELSRYARVSIPDLQLILIQYQLAQFGRPVSLLQLCQSIDGEDPTSILAIVLSLAFHHKIHIELNHSRLSSHTLVGIHPFDQDEEIWR